MADIMIPSPAGFLEARLQEQDDPSAPVALILHPHPLYGGTMHTKVVYTLFSSFFEEGFTVVRFNFRGVGQSTGSYDEGRGELDDAEAVLAWLKARYPGAQRWWIAGFSFGAWLTLKVATRHPACEGFVAVAPPASRFDFDFLEKMAPLGLIIQGSADEVVDPASVYALADRVHIPLHTIEGADHFFRDHLALLKRDVVQYLRYRSSGY